MFLSFWRRRSTAVSALPPDGNHAPRVLAEEARLVYITDAVPGIQRQRRGKGFFYVDERGRNVSRRRTLKRIDALRIPPAWNNVWISPVPHGHLQATGIDARGRKQYRYHERWAAMSHDTTFQRMLPFGGFLPKIRARVQKDLARRGMPKEKVIALLVAILDQTGMRVGSAEYARENHSYGLTTLRKEHVHEISGGKVVLHFRGKSGKMLTITIEDPVLAKIVARCRKAPGERLFRYQADNGAYCLVEAEDVNAYLQAITGGKFTAKDFRTWHASAHALRCLRTIADEGTLQHKAIVSIVKDTAAELQNTPAVCKKHYIHPRLLGPKSPEEVRRALQSFHQEARRGLPRHEQLLLHLLKTAWAR